MSRRIGFTALSLSGLALIACSSQPNLRPASTPGPDTPSAIVVFSGVPLIQIDVDGKTRLEPQPCPSGCVVDGIPPGPREVSVRVGPPGDFLHEGVVVLPPGADVTLELTWPGVGDAEGPGEADAGPAEPVGGVRIAHVAPYGTANRTGAPILRPL